jgi:hypothetical protein
MEKRKLGTQSANSMSMKSPHAATLALVGWYLMVPPVREGRANAPET